MVKNPIELQLLSFINLIQIKEKNICTIKHLKKTVHRAKSIDGLKSLKPLEIVIKMFDHLKGQVHATNQNELLRFLKF